jgi:hypothetical protein
MASPQGGDTVCPGTPTTFLEDVDGGPWEAMPDAQECPPPFSKASMEGPLGGDVGDLEAPTTYLEDIDGGPLGGDAGDPRAHTTYLKDIDGGPLGGPTSVQGLKMCCDLHRQHI